MNMALLMLMKLSSLQSQASKLLAQQCLLYSELNEAVCGNQMHPPPPCGSNRFRNFWNLVPFSGGL